MLGKFTDHKPMSRPRRGTPSRLTCFDDMQAPKSLSIRMSPLCILCSAVVSYTVYMYINAQISYVTKAIHNAYGGSTFCRRPWYNIGQPHKRQSKAYAASQNQCQNGRHQATYLPVCPLAIKKSETYRPPTEKVDRAIIYPMMTPIHGPAVCRNRSPVLSTTLSLAHAKKGSIKANIPA